MTTYTPRRTWHGAGRAALDRFAEVFRVLESPEAQQLTRGRIASALRLFGAFAVLAFGVDGEDYRAGKKPHGQQVLTVNEERDP